MRPSTRRILRDYFVTISLAVSIGFLIRTFVLQTFWIPTWVMKPTLLAGDTVFAAKWPFWLNTYQPTWGDVVIFSNPDNPEKPHLDFVKRVIGLPGDEVQAKAGQLFVNGQRLFTSESSGKCHLEKHINGREYRVCGILENFDRQKVPENSVFVLGDFRSFPKQKGRTIEIKLIKGKALWISSSAANGASLFQPGTLFRRIK